MAYSEMAAQRLRDALGKRSDIVQKRMMGGLVIMVGGHMLGGVDQDKTGNSRFMFRVGNKAEDTLRQPGATQVMMGARPMKGFIFVDEARCDDQTLASWLVMALDYISTLPPR